MDIALIRHAQPNWRPDGRHRLDPTLTDQGHAQAQALAERARSWPTVDEIWVSPAARAQQTAAPLIEVLGAPARTLDWLVEVRQPPAMEGLTKEQIRELFSGWRDQPADQMWAGRKGGESLNDFGKRIGAGFDAELNALGGTRQAGSPSWANLPQGRRVVVVSHAGTSGVALAHLLEMPQEPWPWARFRLGHAGMNVVRARPMSTGQIFELHGFNDRGHLPKDQQTH